MKLAWTIARRYLFAKKSHHLINVISWVSVLGVAVGTFGLVVVLSVFNGFGNLILSLYNSFDPDMKVMPYEGKTFIPDAGLLEKIRKHPDVAQITFVREDNALLRYMDRQYVVTLKGVSANFLQTTGISSKMLEGEALLEKGGTRFMIPGAQIAYSLGIRPGDFLHPVSIFMPQRGIEPGMATLDPSSAFIQRSMTASGIFGVQQDFDAKYVIAPLSLMQELTSDTLSVSALELQLRENADQDDVQASIQSLLGSTFTVKNRLQQHDFLYKIIGSEKVAVYFILCFILLIAAFNLFGTLTMLILDKKSDMQTLYHIGADLPVIQRVFLLEGLMISVGGAVTGIVLGAIVCGIQQMFGLIKIGGGESFVVEAYPVAMQWTDFALILFIVTGIGYIAAAYTSRTIVARITESRLKDRSLSSPN